MGTKTFNILFKEACKFNLTNGCLLKAFKSFDQTPEFGTWPKFWETNQKL